MTSRRRTDEQGNTYHLDEWGWPGELGLARLRAQSNVTAEASIRSSYSESGYTIHTASLTMIHTWVGTRPPIL